MSLQDTAKHMDDTLNHKGMARTPPFSRCVSPPWEPSFYPHIPSPIPFVCPNQCLWCQPLIQCNLFNALINHIWNCIIYHASYKLIKPMQDMPNATLFQVESEEDQLSIIITSCLTPTPISFMGLGLPHVDRHVDIYPRTINIRK